MYRGFVYLEYGIVCKQLCVVSLRVLKKLCVRKYMLDILSPGIA